MEPRKEVFRFRRAGGLRTWSCSRLGVACLAVAAGTAVAQRTVWIVDRAGGPGVHFFDLPPAVAAAQPGDRIEVRGTGGYSPLVLSKGLDVEATGGASILYCEIVGLPAGEWARVSGFTVWAPINKPTVVLVRNCQGPVMLRSNRVSPTWQLFWHTEPAMRIDKCTAVLVVDGSVHGAPSDAERGHLAQVGVVATDSRIAFQRTIVAGGGGSASRFRGPVPGAAGLVATNCEVFAAGTQFMGGAGAGGLAASPCVPPSGGGAAVSVIGPSLFMATCRIAGGIGGPPANGCGGNKAPDGEALRAWATAARVTADCILTGATGNVTVIPVLPAVSSPVTASRGTPAAFTWTARAGTVVFPMLAAGQGHLQVAGIEGAFLLPTQGLVPLAAFGIGATGSLVMTIPVPNDPSLAEAIFLLQGLAFDPASRVSLTNAGDVRVR